MNKGRNAWLHKEKINEDCGGKQNIELNLKQKITFTVDKSNSDCQKYTVRALHYILM